MANLKNNLRSIFLLCLVVLLVIFSVLTYIKTDNFTSFNSHSVYTSFLIISDFILIVIFTILSAKKLFASKIKHKKTIKGSRLQIKILVIFSLISSIPAILIAISSTLFFNYAINEWFNKKVSTALDESVVVAESYISEHQETIRTKAKSMAMEIDNNVLKYDLSSNKQLFTDIVSSLAELNSLSEAVIFQNHKPVITSKYSFSLSFDVFLSEDYRKASTGEVVLIKDTKNKVRAMVMLYSIPNSFLVVGKHIDTNVVNHIKKSQGAADQYKNLKNQIISTQFKFTILFFIASTIILLIAIYAGIAFSGTIINPILNLVRATKKVQEGDFSTKVDEGPDHDEIANLSRAFNLMTERIYQQQNKLMNAYHEIDGKRKFNEAILSGVSTGIIYLSVDKRISLINNSGMKLLRITPKCIGNTVDKILPYVSEIIDQLAITHKQISSQEIKINISGKLITLFLKVSVELDEKQIIGYIITFDDTTKLIEAQRYAAWSDVARRIAHEVKNPLTPIKLSAERLQDKYSEQVNDKATFKRYTSTITRHVNDIGNIIEEFSYFARMPSPVMQEVNLNNTIDDVVFSRKCVSPKIKYSIAKTSDDIIMLCDQTQINQMLLNILKNAEESIETTDNFLSDNGKVEILLSKENKYAKIIVRDNGKGFNKSQVSKILEPYFTTKDKGTGLGLSIVKKIVDDHTGELIIDGDQDGAIITILIPLTPRHK